MLDASDRRRDMPLVPRSVEQPLEGGDAPFERSRDERERSDHLPSAQRDIQDEAKLIFARPGLICCLL